MCVALSVLDRHSVQSYVTPSSCRCSCSSRECGIWGQGDVTVLCSPTTVHGSGPDNELGVLMAVGGSGSTSLRVLTF